MDERSEKTLKQILTKELHELTDFDKGFLKARWSYVGKKSREKYQSIFKEKLQEVKQAEVNEEEEKTVDSPFATPVDEEEDIDE